MIVGLNEKLERMLGEFRDRESGVDAADVLNCVSESVAAGDCWYVPAQLLEDGMNETDVGEGFAFGELPMFQKLTVTNKKDESFFCAFTSEEAMNADHEDGVHISVKYGARALLRDLLETEEMAGLVINPWTKSFKLTKERVKKILELADGISDDEAASLRSYRLAPKAVIDTNGILEGWREGWQDGNGKGEPWELVNYPIMPDGHILLLFRMRGEILGGHVSKLEAIHSFTYYRVLEIGMESGKPEILNRYRFKAQDAHVSTVFLHDGILRAVISVEGREDCDVLQMVPVDDDTQYTIYRDVETVVTDSRGNVAVAYRKNLRDPARCPVMVFDRDGKITDSYHDVETLACADVNLDSGEHVWFSLHPSATLNMLDKDSQRVIRHKVALQGFRSFALSTDRSKLFVSFTEYGGGSVHFVMTADENGDYVNPMRFEFLPKDADGKILEAKDCFVFGQTSAMKSWVILNADGLLHLYDIDDCCEATS